jgi:hypothetical protein
MKTRTNSVEPSESAGFNMRQRQSGIPNRAESLCGVFLLGDIANGGRLLNIPGKKSRQEFIVEYMTVSNGRSVC